MSASVTRGENPTLTLTVTDGNTPVDISAASAITTKFPQEGKKELSVTGHVITDGANGVYTVSLTAAQTETLGLGSKQNIVNIMTIGSNIIIAHFENELEVKSGSVFG